MSENKQRFETMLDYDLDAANAASGAFGKFYKAQQNEYVLKRGEDLGGTVDMAVLRREFDEKVWHETKDGKEIGLAAQLKGNAARAYDGATAEPSAEEIGSDVMDKAGGVVSGGISSLLTGGDFGSGLSHHMRHAILGGIMNIPFVGDFLAKVTAYVGSRIKSITGQGGENYKALSWDQASQKVERENIKERLNAQLGQVADVDKLADMVNKSASPFTEEEKQHYRRKPTATEAAPAEPAPAEPERPAMPEPVRDRPLLADTASPEQTDDTRPSLDLPDDRRIQNPARQDDAKLRALAENEKNADVSGGEQADPAASSPAPLVAYNVPVPPSVDGNSR